MNVQAIFIGVTSIILGAGLTPCRGSAPIAKVQEPMLEFEVLGGMETAVDAAPTMQSASAEAMELTGAIATPNPCYDVEAELVAEGSALTLTLTAKARGGFCAEVVAAFEYRARITGLDAGNYELTTVHAYPETGWERQEFTLELDVP